MTLSGLASEFGVDFHDFTGNRCENVACSLDAFDHCDGFVGGNLAADFGEFDIYDVPQLPGCVRGDADGCNVAIDAQPFMFFRVL